MIKDRVKAISLSLIAMSFCCHLSAQFSFQFKERKHDLGDIADTVKVLRHTFQFQNIIDIPVTVRSFTVGCSCMKIVDYTKDSILAGEWGEVVVELNTDGMEGPFDKPANMRDSRGRVYLLSLTGNILTPQDTISVESIDSTKLVGLKPE